MPFAALMADLIVAAHFAFIAFVVLGTLVILKWPRAAILHLPCLCWAIYIEFSGAVCPLTPLENHYRMLAGEAGYRGGFIQHYITPIIYPEGLTRQTQLILGAALTIANLLAYGRLGYRILTAARIGSKR